ncbi:MAG: PHP domain-containing protein [Lachnospiraceae bacterium]|nr:PHP domain-containing protein [Lachnospiraceae bacterium]
MKFDMHCHTKEGSMDGQVSIDGYISLLKKQGFGGMLVTDHNSYNGYREWKKNIKEQKHKDFIVWKGVEYDTMDCGHILVIMPEGVKLWILEMRGMPVAVLIRIVHYYGGILGPAHPYGEKYMSAITTRGRKRKYADKISKLVKQFDFIESFNACESPESNAHARALANKYHKPGLGGSDAHKPACIGTAYTLIPAGIKTESQFIAFIRKKPRLESGGTYYEGTTKDKLGKVNRVLVDSFFIYNKLGGALRSKKRRRELENIFDRDKSLH